MRACALGGLMSDECEDLVDGRADRGYARFPQQLNKRPRRTTAWPRSVTTDGDAGLWWLP
jgi:hypothetical protein